LGRGAYFLVGGPYLDGGAPVTYEEVAIMTARSGPCTLSRANQLRRGFGFLIYNGTGYMHDPRVVSRARFDRVLTIRTRLAAAQIPHHTDCALPLTRRSSITLSRAPARRTF
jgi:hypothetical protein